jgi:hypothetical protein
MINRADIKKPLAIYMLEAFFTANAIDLNILSRLLQIRCGYVFNDCPLLVTFDNIFRFVFNPYLIDV